MKIFRLTIAVILSFAFFLVGTKVYNYLNFSKEKKNEQKNKLKKSAKILNECFDLKNKSQRTLKDSMRLIEYCLKKYGSEK